MTINNLSEYFLQEHPRESAQVLEHFPSDILVRYFEVLPVAVVANLIRYFLPSQAVACLGGMEIGRAASVIEQLGTDSSARLLRRMKGRDQVTLLNAVSSGYAQRLRSVLRYPLGTVGQHMSPNIFIALASMLASEAINAARSASSELHGDIFIVDNDQRLVGVIDVKNLVFASPEIEVNKIMNIPDMVLNARTNLDSVKDHPKWQFKEALPVVDHKNIFVGILKRSVMFDALSTDQNQNRRDDNVMDTMMEVADLFWDICTNIVLPQTETRAEGRQDDRK